MRHSSLISRASNRRFIQISYLSTFVVHIEDEQGCNGLLKTNDPAGFTIVDVLAWGALGHAIAFFILATANNGYEPTF
jgi:photosystem I reaction center subunit V